MTIRVTPMPDQSRLAIDGELTIYTAAIAMPELLNQLCHYQQLDVAIGGVHEIDAAGMQLLILLKKEAALQGKSVRFVEHSAAVTEVLELCNLFAFFGDPVLIEHKAIEHKAIERNVQHSKEQHHVS